MDLSSYGQLLSAGCLNLTFIKIHFLQSGMSKLPVRGLSYVPLWLPTADAADLRHLFPEPEWQSILLKPLK